jgi:hypothetical protein
LGELKIGLLALVGALLGDLDGNLRLTFGLFLSPRATGLAFPCNLPGLAPGLTPPTVGRGSWRVKFVPLLRRRQGEEREARDARKAREARDVRQAMEAREAKRGKEKRDQRGHQ